MNRDKSSTDHLGQESTTLIFSSKLISSQALIQVVSMYQHLYKFTISECELNFSVRVDNIGLVTLDDSFCEKFKNEVYDQQIRLDLQKEFGALRDTIVKYAFFPAEEHIRND